MNFLSRFNKGIGAFETVIILALQLFVIILIAVSTAALFVVAAQTLRSRGIQIGTVADLLFMVQRAIAGILTVVLGLEVLETLKIYQRDHHVRVQVILVVAIIAAGRQLVQVDFEHASPWSMLALSAVIVSLTLGYFLVKKAVAEFPSDSGNGQTGS